MPEDWAPALTPSTKSSAVWTATLSDATTSTANGRPAKTFAPSSGARNPTIGGLSSAMTCAVVVAEAVWPPLSVATAWSDIARGGPTTFSEKRYGPTPSAPRLTPSAKSSTLLTATSSCASSSTSSAVPRVAVAEGSGRTNATVGGWSTCTLTSTSGEKPTFPEGSYARAETWWSPAVSCAFFTTS